MMVAADDDDSENTCWHVYDDDKNDRIIEWLHVQLSCTAYHPSVGHCLLWNVQHRDTGMAVLSDFHLQSRCMTLISCSAPCLRRGHCCEVVRWLTNWLSFWLTGWRLTERLMVRLGVASIEMLRGSSNFLISISCSTWIGHTVPSVFLPDTHFFTFSV